MNTNINAQTPWSTASFGETANTTPMELAALGKHLEQCQGAHGRFFAMQSIAQVMHGFVAARFVTTLVVVTLLIGVISLAL